MLKKENPENLMQWLAAYRRAEFPQNSRAALELKQLTEAIDNNCAATIRLTGNLLRQIRHDGEELFSLCALRHQALALRRACKDLAASPQRRHRRSAFNAELVSLRSQYDNLISSIKHTFFLLDHDLARRIDGAL